MIGSQPLHSPRHRLADDESERFPLLSINQSGQNIQILSLLFSSGIMPIDEL